MVLRYCEIVGIQSDFNNNTFHFPLSLRNNPARNHKQLWWYWYQLVIYEKKKKTRIKKQHTHIKFTKSIQLQFYRKPMWIENEKIGYKRVNRNISFYFYRSILVFVCKTVLIILLSRKDYECCIKRYPA